MRHNKNSEFYVVFSLHCCLKLQVTENKKKASSSFNKLISEKQYIGPGQQLALFWQKIISRDGAHIVFVVFVQLLNSLRKCLIEYSTTIFDKGSPIWNHKTEMKVFSPWPFVPNSSTEGFQAKNILLIFYLFREN